MKNFKKLSREELKSINGGLLDGSKSCKLVTLQSDGSYVTSYGTCSTYTTVHYDSLTGTTPVYSTTNSFCDTGSGQPSTLTSNGGQSRC